jgi:Hemerythrin HHE cation binding domain
MQRILDALELLTAQHDEIDALIEKIATPAKPDARGQAIADLADHLTVHLAAEQELFYPAVSTLISTEVLTELMAEHAEIKRVLADLLWFDAADDERIERKLSGLKALMECHATWQESVLFERVAEARSPREIVVLGAEIGGWIDSIVDATPFATAA